ncbi:MAG: aldehyde dehydrogenase family protein, partial [Gemmatimonadales bacterium]
MSERRTARRSPETAVIRAPHDGSEVGVCVELGGNAAAIVEPDADLEWAATRLALGGFFYAGQSCISTQRI